jgi:hypothetical protein
LSADEAPGGTAVALTSEALIVDLGAEFDIKVDVWDAKFESNVAEVFETL